VAQVSKSQDMALILERKILDGVIYPGEPLASERELASEFDVSRSSVREVLRELSQAGLVEVRPGRGTFVTRPAKNQPAAGIVRWATRVGVTPRNLIDARISLECDVAWQAAQFASPAETDFLNNLLEQIDREHEPLRASQLDIAFHLGIARIAGNPVAEMLLTTLAPLTAGLVARTHSQKEIVSSRSREHRSILNAVSAGDSEKARRSMKAHLLRGKDVLPEFDEPLQFSSELVDADALDGILASSQSGTWPATQKTGRD